jgi:hypothetical protein
MVSFSVELGTSLITIGAGLNNICAENDMLPFMNMQTEKQSIHLTVFCPLE